MSRFTKILAAILLLASLTACASPAAETTPVAEPAVENTEITTSEETVPSENTTEAFEEEAAVEEEEFAAETEKENQALEETAAANEAGNGETEAPTANITVYISPDALGLALEEAFEAEYGDVLTIVGGSWCRKVKSEQEAGDIQADVLYGAEPLFYQELANSDALLNFTPEQTANLKAEYQWENPFYTIADLRYIGIVYNNTLVSEEELPTTFDGLNESKWERLTAVPDATQCSAAFGIAAALAQPDLDTSFFEAAKTNGALLSDRAGKLPEMVAGGEAALGIGPHDPVVRLQNKAKKEGVESPVDIAWAEEGTYVIPRPIAIVADENRSEEETAIAQAFVEFVLSPQGQALVVKKGGFVPAVEGIEYPQLVSEGLELIQVDWDWVFENQNEIQEAFLNIMYGE